jgi:hypothetical protein
MDKTLLRLIKVKIENSQITHTRKKRGATIPDLAEVQ